MSSKHTQASHTRVVLPFYDANQNLLFRMAVPNNNPPSLSNDEVVWYTRLYRHNHNKVLTYGQTPSLADVQRAFRRVDERLPQLLNAVCAEFVRDEHDSEEMSDQETV